MEERRSGNFTPELKLPFSYAFVNISFSIKNSTICVVNGQTTAKKDTFGFFIDCDFSSKSPCNGSEERSKQQMMQEMIKSKEEARNYLSKTAEEREQMNLR